MSRCWRGGVGLGGSDGDVVGAGRNGGAGERRRETGGIGGRAAGPLENAGQMVGDGLDSGVNTDELVVAVRADVSNGERGVGGDLLLDAERIRDEGRHLQVGLDTAGDEQSLGRSRRAGIDGQARDWQGRDAVDGIEGRVLIHAVAEGVLQLVVHAEAGADYGVAIGARAPGDADAGLGQELRVVGGEGVVSDVGSGWRWCVRKGVVGGAAMGFVPTG